MQVVAVEAIILPAEEVLVVQVEVAQVECKPQVQPELQTQAVVEAVVEVGGLMLRAATAAPA